MIPDLNFDSGAIKLNYWSTIPQAYTYGERLERAAMIGDLLHPNMTVLVDYLEDNPYGNYEV